MQIKAKYVPDINAGSFWNRFANVLAVEEVNRLSREVLIKIKDIVQENGFELLYADTDSVFLKKVGAPIEDYENLKDIISMARSLKPIFDFYTNQYLFLSLICA